MAYIFKKIQCIPHTEHRIFTLVRPNQHFAAK